MRAASRVNDLARLSNGCGTAVAMEGMAIVDVVFSPIRVGAPWDPIRKDLIRSRRPIAAAGARQVCEVGNESRVAALRHAGARSTETDTKNWLDEDPRA